ncbi:MAG: cardiolipin synthase [Elusimicrobia bacterium]|nr:cardiolipin synthase [Elusimicrobiota bacterium]MBK7687913.1 cardiolipin synthase [Elusimicrobiota bacterium]MBK8125170.1 cardiolipin synthase [Elusimicrobiota bacterium]MBK8652290.1 cardiolipin synthase [Elusimicrobiota bacterium]MBP8005236.1 cardiolipin synthase [Elusimicrobiota bacterium]
MTTEAIFLLKFIAILDLGGALLFTFVAISRKRDPAVTLAWVLGFFLLPVVGMLLYVFFGYQRFALRRRAAPNPLHRLLLLKESAERFPGGEPLAKTPMETLAEALTDFPALGGNRVDVYTRSDDTEEALTRAIRLARHHVHMCYYIFEPDRTGLRFRDLLIEQARRGVECRVLMDAVGSYRIGPSFLKPLQQAGVKTAFFNPFRTFKRPWAFNARNHRKLTVVDGTIGFMGSQNIGHHFWRSGSRRIQWRETDIRLEGPATVELQTVFAEDWHFATGENLLGDAYFPPPTTRGVTRAQLLPTGPNKRENILGMIFLEALHSARHRVTLTTPYFIPTPSMTLAMQTAARKGVRVDLLLPRRTDHPVVTWAARSWYKELLESGVHVYEFNEAFIHSKVVTVDGRWALMGSANMDTRSFLINFELSLLLDDADTAGHLEKQFDRMVDGAVRVKADPLAELSFTRQFWEGLCRLLSPLL